MSNLLAFVVEDSPVIQENLIAALEEMAPVKVVGTAVDQAGALHWLTDSGNRCDIAIIDIFLRRGSGMGVLRSLADAEASFERVVLTNYATADIRRQCLALGASRVFDKSGEIDALVEHCVARARAPPARPCRTRRMPGEARSRRARPLGARPRPSGVAAGPAAGATFLHWISPFFSA